MKFHGRISDTYAAIIVLFGGKKMVSGASRIEYKRIHNLAARISKIAEPTGIFAKAGRVGLKARLAMDVLDTGKDVIRLGRKIMPAELRACFPSPELKATKILAAAVQDQIKYPLRGISEITQKMQNILNEKGEADLKVPDEYFKYIKKSIEIANNIIGFKNISDIGLETLPADPREMPLILKLKAIRSLHVTLSDQIRNPLAVILSSTEYVQCELKEDIHRGRKILEAYLGSIEEQIKRTNETFDLIINQEKLFKGLCAGYDPEIINVAMASLNSLDGFLKNRWGTIILDAKKHVFKINPAAERFYGIKKEDALGQNIFDLLPDSLEKRAVLRLLKKAKAKGCGRQTDMIMSGGRRVVFESVITEHKDLRGQTAGFTIEQWELPKVKDLPSDIVKLYKKPFHPYMEGINNPLGVVLSNAQFIKTESEKENLNIDLLIENTIVIEKHVKLLKQSLELIKDQRKNEE